MTLILITKILLFVDLASFEGAESKVSLLIITADHEASENLSRMDPVWNP
jgi:hypothetical protein